VRVVANPGYSRDSHHSEDFIYHNDGHCYTVYDKHAYPLALYESLADGQLFSAVNGISSYTVSLLLQTEAL